MSNGKFSFAALEHQMEKWLGRLLLPKEKASLALAVQWHSGQYRSTLAGGKRIPYVTHVVGVSRFVISNYDAVTAELSPLEDLVCAALMHDLLEDTLVGVERIRETGGGSVLSLVKTLTKPKLFEAKNREKRFGQYLEGISSGGPDAVYLKLCDSMHNLSRPSTTPRSLFGKTVEKSTKHYVRLLNTVDLGERFKQTYQKALDKAASFQSSKYGSESVKRKGTLEEAIMVAVSVASGKMLEIHDLAEAARKVLGADSAVLFPVSRGKTTTAVHPQGLELSLACRSDCGSGVIEGFGDSSLARIRDGWDFAGECGYVLNATNNKSYLIALGFDEGKAEWMSPQVLQLLFSHITSRFISLERESRSELARVASRIGLELDVRLADRLALVPDDLVRFNEWLLSCESCMQKVEFLIRNSLLRETASFPMKHRVRVEGRIKSPNSILKKMIDRGGWSWAKLHSMPDVAGIRVVFPSLESLYKLLNHLTDGNQFDSFKKGEIHVKLKSDFIAEPTPVGYRCVHLEALVRDAKIDKNIPCEVQFRTVLQDHWANISHTVAYKNLDPVDGERTQNRLRALSDAFNDHEGFISQVLKSSQGA